MIPQRENFPSEGKFTQISLGGKILPPKVFRVENQKKQGLEGQGICSMERLFGVGPDSRSSVMNETTNKEDDIRSPVPKGPATLKILRIVNRYGHTWWTFRIFFIFSSARGGGMGSLRRRGGGSFFVLRVLGGLGFRTLGPRGREGVCSESGNFGGGGNFFFRGRNVYQAS